MKKEDLVVIPKILANIIENKQSGTKCNTLYSVMSNIYQPYLDDWNLTIVDIARAIEEGYTVKREYYSLEQILEFPEGTLLRHEYLVSTYRIHEHTIVRNIDNNKTLVVTKYALMPKWYIVD